MTTTLSKYVKPNGFGSIPSEIKRILSLYDKSQDVLLLVEAGQRLMEANQLVQGKGDEWSAFLDEIGVSEEVAELFEEFPIAWNKYKAALLKERSILLKMLKVNTCRCGRELIEGDDRFEKWLPAWIEYQEACLKERKLILEMLAECLPKIRYGLPDADRDRTNNAEQNAESQDDSELASA
jgi:hypothetical protein